MLSIIYMIGFFWRKKKNLYNMYVWDIENWINGYRKIYFAIIGINILKYIAIENSCFKL